MNEIYGYFIHTDCYNFVKKKFNIDLNFSLIPYTPYLYNINNDKINYGKIKKYQLQSFSYFDLLNDNNEKLILKPSLNYKFIKNIINQFKLKLNRPSPFISSTFFKNNIIKYGNNNKFWIIKNNKWNEIKEKPKIKKILINLCEEKYNFNKKNYDIICKNDKEKNISKKLALLPYIGYTNNKPIFRLSQIKKKNKILINIIYIFEKDFDLYL